MHIARNLCLSLLATIILASTSFAEAGTMTLGELIKFSDCIVIGRVVNARVDGKRIAELEVTQVLKGDPSWKRVRFYAFPFWACDISDARENERGLFFLTSDPVGDPKEKVPVEKDSDGIAIFFITHSGRGRMIFERTEGQDYVYAYKGGEVKFPGSLKYARYPRADDRKLGLIRADDVLSYIRKRL